MENFPLILGNINDLSSGHLSYLFERSRFWKNNSATQLKSASGQRFTVMTLFQENSTRTKLSFAQAAQRLGCHYLDLPVAESSLQKGENMTETLLTLRAQGVDVVIMRSSDDNIYAPWLSQAPIKIINGGNGISEHPSQALLDFFTFEQDGLPLAGSQLVIVGDIRHSRVANSLIALAPHFKLNIILSGPEKFRPLNINPNFTHVRWESDVELAYKQATRIYLLRIQHERHQADAGGISEYLQHFGLSLQRYEKLKLQKPVYHPGPCNIGSELDEALVRSPHYRAYHQVAMSIPMRMALLEAMLTKCAPMNDLTSGFISS